MNKQDIDKVSATLTGAINYFSPMVVALNQADEVFSALNNTIKFKESLEKEVANAKAALETTNRELASSKTTAAKEIDANTAAAVSAKAQADKDIAEAKAQADAEVKSIKASVIERTKKAVADSEAKIAQVNAAEKQAQDAYDKEVAVMAVGKASLQSDVDALEAKLATLREQAKKFAASLVD